MTGRPLPGCWGKTTQILLTLNTARDILPITHGEYADPDDAVREALTRQLSTAHEPRPPLLGSIKDVPLLIEAAPHAAQDLFGPSPVGEGKLVEVHSEWLSAIALEIARRQVLTATSC